MKHPRSNRADPSVSTSARNQATSNAHHDKSALETGYAFHSTRPYALVANRSKKRTSAGSIDKKPAGPHGKNDRDPTGGHHRRRIGPIWTVP